MPANVGEMFYYGPVLWHGQGRKLDQPANMEEAIEAGGLDWEVEAVGLATDEEPPSPVRTRFAIVRKKENWLLAVETFLVEERRCTDESDSSKG